MLPADAFGTRKRLVSPFPGKSEITRLSQVSNLVYWWRRALRYCLVFYNFDKNCETIAWLVNWNMYQIFLHLLLLLYCSWCIGKYTGKIIHITILILNFMVDTSWNVMAHGDARVEKWRGNWPMEWVSSTLRTTMQHGVSSITTADAHNSAASSRVNWRPRRFKWARPFHRKTKSGFCAYAITFQLACTHMHAECHRPFLGHVKGWSSLL